jgi:flagellar M-ring protein FliF
MEEQSQNIMNILKEKYESFKNADPNQKTIVLTVFALVISILVVMTFWINRVNYKTLYRNLGMQEASEVTNALKDKKVKYRLEDDGKTILVPAEQIYQLRLDLAGEGLPKTGITGFEIFDKTDFQSSEFAENVKYVRALQGELVDTINHLDAVENSKVNLSIPKRSVFIDEASEPSASVVLKLKAGRSLREDEIRGIAQLVASCVEGLKMEKVTVMSTDGKLLSDFIQEGMLGTTSHHLKIQQQLQKQVESKVQALLNSVLGQGKSVVNAHIDIKMDQKAIKRETFQPATENVGVIRSQQTMIENYDQRTAQAMAQAQPQPQPEPAGEGRQPQPGPAYRQQSMTTNYEVSKVIENETVNPGQINRMTVGVLIDTTAELTAQQLSDLEAVIASVSGIDISRGDELTVKTIKFSEADLAETPTSLEYMDLAKKYGPGVLASFAPLLILMILMLQLRGMGRRGTGATAVLAGGQAGRGSQAGQKVDLVAGGTLAPPPTNLYPPVDDMGPARRPSRTDDTDETLEVIRNIARENPRLVANIFEKWVTTEE